MEGTIMSAIANEKKGMLYPAMGTLKSHIPNRYMLVNVVALRARQIAQNAEESGAKLEEKPVTLAIDEVAEGKLDASDMDLTIEEPEDQN
jgi:DNA-directed RNA polymerase subunit omega